MTEFNLTQEEREVNRISLALELAEKTLAKEEDEWKKAGERLKHAHAAQEILQNLAQAVQERAHQRISEVVTSCLAAVFGEDAYQFRILFERKRGRTEARLRFVRRGLEIDPMSGSGGGVVDVAAFALRVACLVLHRPRLSRVVVLDEPFRFVSAQYQDNVRSMLEQLSVDMGVQVVMVTHNESYATGKVIEL